MKRKVKTTTRRKPNKNQQEKQTKKETQNMKRKESTMEKQKNQTVKSESKLDLKKAMSGNRFQGKKHRRREERGNKYRAKKQNENMISKGVDEGNNSETWNLEREDRRKKRDNKNEKQRRVLEKGFWARKRGKVSLKLQDTIFLYHR